MLTEKHKEVEAFLNKHKHRRYTATQIYEKVEGLSFPAEATEICNKLVELGLIREGFNGLRMTYQAWPSAMAVPTDAPKVKPLPQIKTRTGETLPAIETREEKPMELNDEHAAIEDRNQAVGLNNPEPATSSPATGEQASGPGRDWKAECIMLEASLFACRNQLDTAREMEQELGRANQRLNGEIKELQAATEQLRDDLRLATNSNTLMQAELDGRHDLIEQLRNELHLEVENHGHAALDRDNFQRELIVARVSLQEHQDKILEQQGLIGTLQHELYQAQQENTKVIDLLPGLLQLPRPFRAGVMFDEGGNKVLLVDGPAVTVEYTAKQVGVILKAVDNLEWSGA